jgi:hypothetical protein
LHLSGHKFESEGGRGRKQKALSMRNKSWVFIPLLCFFQHGIEEAERSEKLAPIRTTKFVDFVYPLNLRKHNVLETGCFRFQVKGEEHLQCCIP